LLADTLAKQQTAVDTAISRKVSRNEQGRQAARRRDDGMEAALQQKSQVV